MAEYAGWGNFYLIVGGAARSKKPGFDECIGDDALMGTRSIMIHFFF